MAIAEILIVLVISILAAAAVAMFLGVIVATFLVTGAVHVEERLGTLTGDPPGPFTRFARRIVTVPVPRRATAAATPGRNAAEAVPLGANPAEPGVGGRDSEVEPRPGIPAEPARRQPGSPLRQAGRPAA